jgi:hypothetical protein
MAKCRHGAAVDAAGMVEAVKGFRRLKAYKHSCPFSELRSPRINPNMSPSQLMPHSIIHGDACFAYFNKIRGIPPNELEGLAKPRRGLLPAVVGSVGTGENISSFSRIRRTPH